MIKSIKFTLSHRYTLFSSFFSVYESKSVELSNVSIDETVKVFESNKQKQSLGGNPYFSKPILFACENDKTKVEIKKTCRYVAILSSLVNDSRDVFLDDLPDGLPSFREVDHSIKVVLRSKLVSKSTYRLSHYEA